MTDFQERQIDLQSAAELEPAPTSPASALPADDIAKEQNKAADTVEQAVFDQLAAIRAKAEEHSGAAPKQSSSRLITPGQAVEQLERLLHKLSPEMQGRLLKTMNELLASDWLDAETWAGVGYVLKAVVDTHRDTIKRRLSGDFKVDRWGYDEDFVTYILPIIGFLFKAYWRVEMTGLEHIPNQGRALLISNHSGVLPMDGAMIAYGVRENHPAHRLVRALVANWFPSMPFLSVLMSKAGQVTAHPDNGHRLLAEDEVVLVFPEGYKGVTKRFWYRYKLARFGRGGYVRMAIAMQAPIIPVSVVGAEETYPMLADLKPMARLLGFPFFPLTPFFPWLGPLGFIPIPSKWRIDIGEPIDTTQYDPKLAGNPVFVSELSDLVRNKIQEQINARLAQRKSVILG